MKAIVYLFLLTQLLGLTSCDKVNQLTSKYSFERAELEEQDSKNYSQAMIAPPSNQKIEDNNIYQKKIIKNGRISIQTDDVNNTKINLASILKVNNGSIVKEDFSKDNSRISYNLFVKIKPENFENFLSIIENSGYKITKKEINISDITEDYKDIEIRLANKRLYLQKYRDLLKKANNVKEILEIEEKIRELVEEIESSEVRMKSIDNQIAMSSFYIYLFKDLEINNQESEQSIFDRVISSLKSGLTSAKEFFFWLLSMWFYILLLFVIIKTIQHIKKRRREKRLRQN